MHHEDLLKGGIYSTQELEAWRTQLEMGDLHQAIQERIVTGICYHQGGCSIAGIPALDLRGLEKSKRYILKAYE